MACIQCIWVSSVYTTRLEVIYADGIVIFVLAVLAGNIECVLLLLEQGK